MVCEKDMAIAAFGTRSDTGLASEPDVAAHAAEAFRPASDTF